MGLVTERLAIIITASGGQAVGEVKKAESAFGGFTKTQLAAGTAAVLVGKQLLDAAHAASNLSEQVSASNVIFGAGAPQVQKFAKTAVDSFGLSERAALEAANSFAALFKNAGLQDSDTARFSATLTRLGADISSLRNVAQEDVLAALRSGLTGEVEPLRRLGIILNDTTVSARAVQMGLASANGTVDDGAKVLARLNLILEQTGDAQGDFARTADGAANAARRQQAEWENFQATVGKTVLPLLAQTTGSIADLEHALNSVLSPIGGFNSAITLLAKPITSLFDSIGGVSRLFGDHKSATEKAADAQRQYKEDADASAKVQRQLADDTKAATKALDDFEKATKTAASARQTLDDRTKAAARSVREEADARKELSDLEKRGAVDEDKVASAKTKLADASRSVTSALKDETAAAHRVADATMDVADAEVNLARVKAGASPNEIARAELEAAKAQRDRVRSQLDLAKSQRDNNAIVQIGIVAAGQQVGTAEDQRRADLDLADAKDAVKVADLDAVDAEQSLADKRNEGKAGSKDLKDAEDLLKQKKEDLTGAIDAQATAHENVALRQADEKKAGEDLRKAEEGDPDFADKLAQARQKVADAHDSTARAKREEVDATGELDTAENDLEANRRQREADLQKRIDENSKNPFALNRGGLAGPGNGPLNPMAALAGASAGFLGQFSGPPPTFGEQQWQRNLSIVTINTGADPNAVIRAQQQYAAANGGKPR